MSARYDDARELGGPDALDARVLGTPAVLPARFDPLLRRRAALGLRPLAAPALVLVPLGWLIGPGVAGVITQRALSHLDVVVSVALAALGVFVGLALDFRQRDDRRLLLAATLESAVTMGVVAAACGLLIVAWRVPFDVGPVMLACSLAVCASASSASSASSAPSAPSAGQLDDEPDPRARVAARIADLDDVLPILVGGALLAGLQVPTLAGTAGLTALTIVVGTAIAVSGWLLFERAHGDAERGVSVVGTLLLLGGAAAYLDLSPMLAGLAAGLFWTYSPGRADQIIRDDLRKLQHPLVVVLLLTAGAAVRLEARALWLAAPFVLFRLTGKLAGGWLATRLAPALADLGALLLPPGLIGLAFALNLQQVLPPASGVAIASAVTLGTLASELLAVIVGPADAERR